MTKRHVEVPPEMQAAIDTMIEHVDERLSAADTATAVTEILADLFGDRAARERRELLCAPVLGRHERGSGCVTTRAEPCHWWN